MDNETLALKAQTGDKQALEELWSNNLPLFYKLAWKYTNSSYPSYKVEIEGADDQGQTYPNQDILQELYLALVENIGAYSPDKSSFITFIIDRMEWHIYAYMKDQGLVRVPEWLRQLQNRYQHYINDYYMSYGHYPSDDAVMDALKINYKALQAVKGISLSVKSLDTPINGSDDDLMLWEIIPDDAAALSDSITDGLYDEELKGIWDICQKSTTEKEYQFLDLRYRQGEDFSSTAEKMGVSPQRIDSLRGSAFQKLRHNAKLKELAGICDGATKGYYTGGFRAFKGNKDTSCTEKLAVRHVDQSRRRKARRKQESMEELEQSLIDIFGSVPDVV